uniref:Uncharacterized protein n=1 Tax=Cyclophora tenuis TaxID=216820 RepID=A0A7S1CZY4_CYCTE
MLEMMCVGPECRSAIMVRQTGLNGALIIRIHRDDAWLEEMIFWLGRFQSEFADKECLPHENFFWDDEEYGDRYRAFVQQTKELQHQRVEFVDKVNHKEIQRANWAEFKCGSLFLDDTYETS